MSEHRFYEPRKEETEEQRKERERLTQTLRDFVRQGVRLTRYFSETTSPDPRLAQEKENLRVVSETFGHVIKKFGSDYAIGVLLDSGMSEEDAGKFVNAVRLQEKIKSI